MASRTPCAAPHLHHPHPISSRNLLAGTKSSARSGRSLCASQNKRQRFCSYKVQWKLPNETQRMTMRSRIKVPVSRGQLPLLSPMKRHRGIDVWRLNSGPRQPTWRQKARISRGITRLDKVFQGYSPKNTTNSGVVRLVKTLLNFRMTAAA